MPWPTGNRLRGLPPGQKLAFSGGSCFALALVESSPDPAAAHVVGWRLDSWAMRHSQARLYLPILTCLALGFAVASLPALLLGLVGSEKTSPASKADVWPGPGASPLGAGPCMSAKAWNHQRLVAADPFASATSAIAPSCC